MLVIRWPHGWGPRPRDSPDTALPNSGSSDHSSPVGAPPTRPGSGAQSSRGELQGPPLASAPRLGRATMPHHSAPEVSGTKGGLALCALGLSGPAAGHVDWQAG